MSGGPNGQYYYMNNYDDFCPDSKTYYKSGLVRPGPDVRPVPVGGGPELSVCL
jgi:hypothetical protein